MKLLLVDDEDVYKRQLLYPAVANNGPPGPGRIAGPIPIPFRKRPSSWRPLWKVRAENYHSE